MATRVVVVEETYGFHCKASLPRDASPEEIAQAEADVQAAFEETYNSRIGSIQDTHQGIVLRTMWA